MTPLALARSRATCSSPATALVATSLVDIPIYEMSKEAAANFRSGPSVVLIDRDDISLSDQDEIAGARLLQTTTTMGGSSAST